MGSSEDDVASLFSFDSSSEDERFALDDTNEGMLIHGFFGDAYDNTLDEFGLVPVNMAGLRETGIADTEVSSEFTVKFSDENLEKMSIQEFNKQLRQLPVDLMQTFRRKRRVLKNRKYSQKFRQKGFERKHNIAAENRVLESAIFQAKEELRKVTKEKDEFKQKYARLKRTVAVSHL